MSQEVDQLVNAIIEGDDDFSVKEVSLPGDELLAWMVQGVLELSGKVTRNDNRYVHQYSTSIELFPSYNFPDDWPPEQRAGTEEALGPALDALEKDIKEKMESWNHKIYRELEEEYNYSISDEAISSWAEANDIFFSEDGDEADQGLTFDQLSDSAKDDYRWKFDQRHNDTEWWSEPVILEWKWLLEKKGFTDVEINFSGFSSQGDGASFTGHLSDAKTYLIGPDPLTFPENEREQLSEGRDDDFEVKDVAHPLSPDEVALMVKAVLRRANVRRLHIRPSALVKTDRSVYGEIRGTTKDAEQQINMALTRLPALPGYIIKPWLNMSMTNWGGNPRRQKFAVHINSILPMNEAEQSDKDDLKDVSGPGEPRKQRPIKDIKTTADYKEYEQRVAEFFQREGINNLSAMSDAEGNTIQDEFSWRPCDCCRRQLGGTRIQASGYNPTTGEIQEYKICTDCEYYAAYGQLDDMTMMDMKDEPEAPIQERYGGAEQERGIWYHGTSAKLIPKILSQGLITDPKVRAWDADPYPTSTVQATRKSLPGIYVTTRLGTATSSAQKVAHRDKSNQAIVVMELQPRSLIADEDDVNSHLKHIEDHLQGSQYHHVWPYMAEVYPDQIKPGQEEYIQQAQKRKLDWVNRIARYLVHGYNAAEKTGHPELEKQVKEMLFNEGFRVMLERNVAYIKDNWDLSQWKKQWHEGFGDYDNAPPIPDVDEAEAKWLAFSDKLARTLKDKARPIKDKSGFKMRDTGRATSNIGFTGSNRIICIIERTDARTPDYHSTMIVHYGKPPEKLIKDWNEGIGQLQPGDIVYKNKVSEEWTFEIKPWKNCKSINYCLGESHVGGHTFPARMDDGSLKEIAETQIKVFMAAGQFEPGKWKNVWEWFKQAQQEA